MDKASFDLVLIRAVPPGEKRVDFNRPAQPLGIDEPVGDGQRAQAKRAVDFGRSIVLNRAGKIGLFDGEETGIDIGKRQIVRGQAIAAKQGRGDVVQVEVRDQRQHVIG